MVVSLESGSEHPLARGVAQSAAENGVSLLEVRRVRAHAGRGVAGLVSGRELRLGSPRWMSELGIDLAPMTTAADAERRAGRTVSWVADAAPGAHKLLGFLCFGDGPKPTAAKAVAALTAAGVRVVLVTGDTASSAEAVARQLGIGEVRAEILPDGKAAIVSEFPALRRSCRDGR